MPKKRYRPEDIIAKLREADILVSQGKTIAETIKQLGVSDITIIAGEKNTVLGQPRGLKGSKNWSKKT